MNETIELIGFEKIELWKDNPRKNDDAVIPLAKVLVRHGQKSPIVVWRKNNVCYKGNTTYKALKWIHSLSVEDYKKFCKEDVGIKVVPIRQNGVKTMYVDFPSEQSAIAYGIADNKASEFAEWDYDLLSKFLEQKTVYPPEATGFSKAEINYLMFQGDEGEIEKIEETSDGIRKRFTIRCPLDIADEVKSELVDLIAAINKALGEKKVELS